MAPGGALRDRLIWQLAFGFFACGFTMGFPNGHMAAWAMEMEFGEVNILQHATHFAKHERSHLPRIESVRKRLLSAAT